MSAAAADAAPRSAGHLRVDGNASQKQNELSAEKARGNDKFSPLYHCARSRCSGSWCWDGPATEPVRCPQCSALNCLACRAIHDGLSCEQYIVRVVKAMDSGALEDSKEKKKRLQEQLELYTKDIVVNSAPFTCPVCKSDVAKGDGVCLKSCHHSVCRACVVQAIERSGTVAVKCPYSGNNTVCDIAIEDTEVRALLTKEEYEDYLQKGLLEVKVSAKNFFHCKASECPWWCFIEASVPEVECKLCGTKNCVNCDAIHLGMTCAEYQAWQASMKQLVPVRCANDLDNLVAVMLHVAYMACIVYLLVKCIFP
ncbi:ranBP-type and C3HC4-type zinc finger-containing protein 1-like [Dermacentor andersoni]|uniref:ranBP-type and C3HC4-type zinc finger-containing protein 1-like n=1 Tax=Dermacentor andersoni TaxID=34620 RepID=UPI0021554611|nr:ranBP-type and C3HC4-type zinc finger-containing protein 1-like [Dermacentor andersoni]